MACSWAKEEYFGDLMCTDKRAHVALELLVDDLHVDKDRTITRFLCHSGSEDFLWGLVRLLGSDNPRVAGNSAYIIGTLAESEIGCLRVLSVASNRHYQSNGILHDLTKMLTFEDTESVMNAAGTMGTLAETAEGRQWMLSQPCMQEMVQHITMLLSNQNLWTASNAALVLARLCISEDGCAVILSHPQSKNILSRLVTALGVDEAGRGMNAAFAIGRLCDMEIGRQQLLALPESEKMISSLAKMLACEDTGASKNACFALSCLATNLEGHSRLLQNMHVDSVLQTLSQLLSAEDSETGWFAAMTLRTLASQPKGCLRLRDNSHIISALKLMHAQPDVNPDLKEEVVITLDILKHLDQPAPPSAHVKGPDHVFLEWEAATTKSGFPIKYQLYEGGQCVYDGPDCSLEIGRLEANTMHTYKLRTYTEGDVSSFSDPVTITTEEDLPGPPTNLQVLAVTISQLKIGWETPALCNGIIKGYYVYVGQTMVEHTADLTAIITGLAAGTSYEIQVCAATVKGKGERASVTGTTAEPGAHAPSKPHVQVLGRNEMHITWDPPEVPLGRITRYDLSMNGKVVYSGTELSFALVRLTPDTEYTFVVTALTNEGKFDSKPTKKRTLKNEYEANRPPLYQPPPCRKESEDEAKQTSKKYRSPSEGNKPTRNPAKSSKGQRSHMEGERPKSACSLGSHNVASSPLCEQVPNDDSKSPLQQSPSSLPHPSLGMLRSKTSLKNSHLSNKKENSRHILQRDRSSSSPLPVTSKDISSHRFDRSRRSTQVKPSLPVTVSYVTIQCGNDSPSELDPVTTDSVYNKKFFGRSHTTLESGNPFSLRLDRSKTTLISTKPSTRPNLSRINTDIKLGASAGSMGSCSVVASGGMESAYDTSPSQLTAAQDTDGDSYITDDAISSHASFPRPSVPNHSYPAGTRVQGVGSDSGIYGNSQNHLSQAPSPSHIGHEDATLDATAQYLRHKGASSSTAVETHVISPEMSSYFIESQQAFIQRAHTFIRSHRPTSVHHSKFYHSRVPVQVLGGSTSNMLGMPMAHSKFVPMQLRTQPSNLSVEQLHRMSTTLQDSRVLPSRRLESLPNNQPQIGVKVSFPGQTKRTTFQSSELELLCHANQSLPASQP